MAKYDSSTHNSEDLKVLEGAEVGKLKDIFKPYIKDLADIYGKGDLNR